jgi:hypothetical protein
MDSGEAGVSQVAEATTDKQYCSVPEVMKLIDKPFDGSNGDLREFIDNVSTAFELTSRDQHGILLKIVKTRITGDARNILLVPDLTETWADVKAILEKNYAVRRTLDYYAWRRMFNSRQGKEESVSAWAGRIDALQAEFKEWAYGECARDEAKGALALIDRLARGCFVQGLASDRIRTIVRARGEATLLSTCIDIALEEESAILSARDTGSSGHSSVPYRNVVENRTPVGRSDRESNRGYPGSRDRNSDKGYNSGRGVGRCYECGGSGHMARYCMKRN